MRRFVGMSRYSRWSAWLMVGSYVAQVFAGIFVGNYLLSLTSTALTVVLMVLTAIFIGTRLRGINNIVHECVHSSFSDHRGDNVRLGRLGASLLTGCFKQYKDDHLSHHANLGDYENDREMSVIEKFRLHEPLTYSSVARHIATPLLGRHLKMYSGINLSGQDGKYFLALKIGILLAISLFAVFNPYTAVFFVLVPLYYIFPTINFWTDCLDHAGIVGEHDDLEASRNVVTPWLLRLFLFPRNDCFHLVHHLFPQVPARHLEFAHIELSKNPEYQNRQLAMGPTNRNVTEVAVGG